MISLMVAKLARSSMSTSDLLCEEEHVATVKVGTILNEKNVSRPHLEDSIHWSKLTDGAKRTKAVCFTV